MLNLKAERLVGRAGSRGGREAEASAQRRGRITSRGGLARAKAEIDFKVARMLCFLWKYSLERAKRGSL